MTPENYARQSWHAAGSPASLPSLDTLRDRSDRFRRSVSRRNWIEYAAGALVFAGFGITLVAVPLPAMRIACALIIAATAYVLWQLHRRGANLPADDAAGALPVLVHQRAALARQRDALAGVFGWYIAPFVPGIALFFAAPLMADPPSSAEAWVRVALCGAVVAAIFAGVWWLNRFGARDLQRQIDEIDELLAD